MRNLAPSNWECVQDPRCAQGIRYALPTLLQVLVLGLLTGLRTLRDVERLATQVVVKRKLGLKGTPSDTTLDNILRKLDPSTFRDVVVAQVKAMHANKQLDSAINFPYSLVAIDGKALGTDDEKLHPDSHRMKAGDSVCYVLKALRAVLVSSAVKPILDQQRIPAGKGERTGLWSFLMGLRKSYGPLSRCFSFDAGFWSNALVDDLATNFMHFIFALKENAGSPYRFARADLGTGDQDPPKGWEAQLVETHGKKTVIRQFARKDDDLGTCGAVASVWRQRTRVLVGKKIISQEDRYFATSLPKSTLTAAQAMAAIRAHWGIENDSNWTMDAILREDTQAWVRQGMAREVLTWLRIIAYNLLRLIRCRSLRSKKGALRPWRQILEEIRDALLSKDAWAAVGFA
jgi:predicted transposase YbfD/YdcC